VRIFVVLGAFIMGVLAGAVWLAYRSSQETQKSLPESFADVPTEAKKVYVEVRTRATEAVKQARGSMTEEEQAAAESDATQWPEASYVEGIQ
jgi:Flp pilus assembly protein TadB